MSQTGIGSQIIVLVVAFFSWIFSHLAPHPTNSSNPGVLGLCGAIPAAATGLSDKNVTKLKIEDLRVGSGAQAIAGKIVVMNYYGRLVNGTKFDTSCDRGETFEFDLGSGQVIAGFDQGIVGMKVGGIRCIIIPASLGYGAAGAGGVIPPNAALVFDVELIGIK